MRFLYLIGMLCSAWIAFEGIDEKSVLFMTIGLVTYTLNTFFFVKAFKKEVPE